eukprot:12892349-Prorocentrum_lima.AAC.1
MHMQGPKLLERCCMLMMSDNWSLGLLANGAILSFGNVTIPDVILPTYYPLVPLDLATPAWTFHG